MRSHTSLNLVTRPSDLICCKKASALSFCHTYFWTDTMSLISSALKLDAINTSTGMCGDSTLFWTQSLLTDCTRSADVMQKSVTLLLCPDIYVNFPSSSPWHSPLWMNKSKHMHKSKSILPKSFTTSSWEALLWHIRELGLRGSVNGKSHSLLHWLESWMSTCLCHHTELNEGPLYFSKRLRTHLSIKSNVASTDFLVGAHKHMYCVEKCLGKPDHNHLFIQDVNSFNQFWKALPH